MKKKLIITESQLKRLKNVLMENNAYQNLVKKIKEELDNNYEISEKFVKEGGDYSSKIMFTIKIDGELITAKKLFEYLKPKYNASDEFIQQVIRDWHDGKITDDYFLSKNTSIH
jgi:hypothetical protein